MFCFLHSIPFATGNGSSSKSWFSYKQTHPRRPLACLTPAPGHSLSLPGSPRSDSHQSSGQPIPTLCAHHATHTDTSCTHTQFSLWLPGMSSSSVTSSSHCCGQCPACTTVTRCQAAIRLFAPVSPAPIPLKANMSVLTIGHALGLPLCFICASLLQLEQTLAVIIY